jgi:hypothetical protein
VSAAAPLIAPLIALLLWLFNVAAIFIRAAKLGYASCRAKVIDTLLCDMDPAWPLALHRVAVPSGRRTAVYDLTGFRGIYGYLTARIVLGKEAGVLSLGLDAASTVLLEAAAARSSSDGRLYLVRYRDVPTLLLTRRAVFDIAPRTFNPHHPDAPVPGVLAAFSGDTDITAAVAGAAASLVHGGGLSGADFRAFARVGGTDPVVIVDKTLREYHFE